MLPPEYDDIDRYQQYLVQLFPGDTRLSECAGASASEIAELERWAARHPLPALYRGYLERFGRNDGPIRLCDDCACSAPALLDYLARKAGKEPPITPPNCVLIGIRALSFARSLCYADGGEPTVVVNDFEEIDHVVANSFRTYLYRETWAHKWFTGNRGIHLYSAEPNSMPAIVSKAEELGFVPAFFNDGLRYSAEREGVALYAMPDYERVSAALIGPDTWRVASAANELRHALALRD